MFYERQMVLSFKHIINHKTKLINYRLDKPERRINEEKNVQSWSGDRFCRITPEVRNDFLCGTYSVGLSKNFYIRRGNKFLLITLHEGKHLPTSGHVTWFMWNKVYLLVYCYFQSRVISKLCFSTCIKPNVRQKKMCKQLRNLLLLTSCLTSFTPNIQTSTFESLNKKLLLHILIILVLFLRILLMESFVKVGVFHFKDIACNCRRTFHEAKSLFSFTVYYHSTSKTFKL